MCCCDAIKIKIRIQDSTLFISCPLSRMNCPLGSRYRQQLVQEVGKEKHVSFSKGLNSFLFIWNHRFGTNKALDFEPSCELKSSNIRYSFIGVELLSLCHLCCLSIRALRNVFYQLFEIRYRFFLSPHYLLVEKRSFRKNTLHYGGSC